MVSRIEEQIDRRQLRRKVTFWRAAAFIVLALAIIAAALWNYRGQPSGDQIAKVRIDGTITDNEDLIARINAVRDAPNVKGVILAINSPGGTTVGGEAIYAAVRSLAEKKPTAAQVGTLAASAGYMIACGADQIIARQSSIVGSIGVLVQFPNVSGLMDKLGITLEDIKSSPLKAEPSPFNPTTEPERAMVRNMIMDTYSWFVDLVASRRPLSRDQVLALADGSIFTGRQAVQNKLIDAVGGEDVTIKWLESKGVAKGLRVVEWKPKSSASAFGLFGTAGWLAHVLGLTGSEENFLDRLGGDRIFLDGMVSLWQPDLLTDSQNK